MNPSFGSGTNLLGATASQVIDMPHGAMQQSPASSGFTPGLLPPPPNVQGAPQAPQMGAMPGAQPVPNTMPQAPQAPLGQSMQPQGGVVGMPPAQQEAQMIVKALISRLASHTKGDAMARGEQ